MEKRNFTIYERVTAAAAAGTALALGLTACAHESASSKPTETNSATPTATAEATPSDMPTPEPVETATAIPTENEDDYYQYIQNEDTCALYKIPKGKDYDHANFQTPDASCVPKSSATPEQKVSKFNVDKAMFANWDSKSDFEKLETASKFFKANGYTKPMPNYDLNSHDQVDDIVNWWIENRYLPVRELYKQDPEIARYLAEDVIAGNSGKENRVDQSLDEPFPLNEVYNLYEGTSVRLFKLTATGDGFLGMKKGDEFVGFTAILQNTVNPEDHLGMEYSIIEDYDTGEKTVRANRSFKYETWREDGLTYYDFSGTK